MFTDKEVKGCGTFICFCLVFIFGMLTGWRATHETWCADSVRRGFAEYNQQTGQWQWKGIEVTP